MYRQFLYGDILEHPSIFHKSSAKIERTLTLSVILPLCNTQVNCCCVLRSNFTFTFHFHTLGKEVATHSSVFAWWAAVYGITQSQTQLK